MKSPYKISKIIADAYKFREDGENRKALLLFLGAARRKEHLSYNTVGFFMIMVLAPVKTKIKLFIGIEGPPELEMKLHFTIWDYVIWK